MSNLTKFTSPERALVFTPHPDDSELGCGGTIAEWVSSGTVVTYVLCTNGDKGSSDPDMTSAKLAAIRSEEQEKAARILGVSNVLKLGYADGFLEDTSEFREKIVKAIRTYKPDVVLATDPIRTKFYLHRDHKITGTVVKDALFPYARDRLYYPEHEKEGLLSHKTRDLLLWGSESPNAYVDISNTIDIKIKALSMHASQVAPGQTQLQMDDAIRNAARRSGESSNSEYAEVFRWIRFSN